jgi:hypothetical protein
VATGEPGDEEDAEEDVAGSSVTEVVEAFGSLEIWKWGQFSSVQFSERKGNERWDKAR